MNKRPHPSAGLGGAKPGVGNVGQNPPLPAGPIPGQQQAQPVYDQNAHAAAWQAYYQQQAAAGISPQAAYAAAAQPAQAQTSAAGSAGQAGTAANPYSNYGYGAGASLPTTQPNTAYNPQQQYQQQYPAAGPQQPHQQQYNAGQYNPQQQPYAAPGPQQPAYNWQQQQGGQAGYGGPPGARPPAGQAPYVAPATAYQQQGGQYKPAVPASPQTPAPGANYGPQQPAFSPGGANPMQNPQARPFSPAQGPQAGGFPPAKRPRFDGPAGGAPAFGSPARGGFSGGRGGPGGMATASPHRPGVNGGPPMDNGPGFNGGNRSVSGASTSSRGGFGPSGRGGRGGGPGPGPGPMMGQGPAMVPMVPGPVPLMGAVPMQAPMMMQGGAVPMRGGMGRGGPPGRGGPHGRGGGSSRGGFNSGPPGFRSGPGGGPPRGPGGNRPLLVANNRPTRGGGPKLIPRADGIKLKENEKTKAQLEAEEKAKKTVMTDFRIVGIEIGNLEWTWGEIGSMKEPESEKTEQTDPSEEEVKEESQAEEIKQEAEEADGEAEKAEESLPERGKKRKAKGSSPDLDDEARASSKKRSSAYRITHGKENEPSAADLASSAKETAISRLRIYFNCPPDTEKPPKKSKASKVAKNKKKKKTEEESVTPADEAVEAEGDAQDVEEEHEAEETQQEVGKTEQEAVEDSEQQVVTEAAQPEVPTVEEAVDEGSPLTDVPSDTESDAVENNLTQEEAPEPEVQVTPEQPDQGQEEQTAETNAQEESQTTGVVATAASVAEAAATAAAELAKNLALSAQNTIAAYGARAKSSAAPAESSGPTDESRVAGSQAGIAFRHIFGPAPAANRLVILYENNTRRMCFDAASVERVCIFRKQGRIDVRMKSREATEPESKPESVKAEDDDVIESDADAAKASSVEGNAETTEAAEVQMPEKHDKEIEPKWNLARGVNVEVFNDDEGAFMPVGRDVLDEQQDAALPPLQQVYSSPSSPSEAFTVTLYLNTLKPLSEPKWCRTGLIDEWLTDALGVVKTADEDVSSWKGKIEIMDPESPPTMQAILEQWCQASAVGPVRDRRRFIKEHLKDVSNLIEILLRLTRGERAIPVGGSPASLQGPLASALNHESVYASHQTHVSLAVLAMYRLTTEYAEKAGEKIATVDDKVVDIIKSLPTSLVNRSLDGLFKEWTGGASAK